MRHSITTRVTSTVLAAVMVVSMVTCGPVQTEVQAKEAGEQVQELGSDPFQSRLNTGVAYYGAGEDTSGTESGGSTEQAGTPETVASETTTSETASTGSEGTGGSGQTEEKPAPVLNSITATLAETSYFIDDAIAWEKLVVTATYSDNTTKTIPKATEEQPDGYTLTDADKVDMTKAGTYTVTVTYQEKTTTVTITVTEPAELTGITAAKTQIYYTQDDSITWDDLTITATYSNGVTKTITGQQEGVAIGSCDLSSVGEKQVTIAYTDYKEGQKKTPVTKETTVTLRIRNVMSKLSAKKTQKTYTVNDILNLDDLTVTVYYNNDKRKKTLTKLDYSTNAASLKLAPSGKKTLTISYTEKDIFTGVETTLTTSIKLTVNVPEVPIKNGVRTANVLDFGADPSDLLTDKAAIQDALDVAASAEVPLVVYIPKGTYYIGNPLYIHSNTTLQLDPEAVIIRNSELKAGDGRDGVNHNMLKVANSGKVTNTVGGYDNGKNIVIEGGTWDGGNVAKANTTSNVINIGHAQNVIVRNTTIKNCYGSHLIEFAGVKNAEVYGCTFSGFRKEAGGVESEAIQLDVCNSDWNAAYMTDGTACSDISVHDNVFTGYPVAVGNHHLLDGHHNKNITITNNKITYTSGKGYQGIYLYGCDNSKAENNTISGFENGMKAYGCVGYSMSKNTISNCNFGIVSAGGSTGTLSSNQISNTFYQGIFVYDTSKLTSITKNTLTNVGTSASAPRDGIAVCGSGSSVTSITGNTINTSKRHGVYVYSGAQVTKINTNVISNTSGSGICVADSKTKVKFKSNQMTSVGTNAIKVANSTYVKQKYTFAPKVKKLNLKAGTMKIKANHLKKVQLKFKKKSYSASTTKSTYTLKYKAYKKKVTSAEALFTDKYKNVITRKITVK
ncbi:MAG: right-handed parallel beta-helix repeat-containing protein [Lachnospiraceae bacterium]|nr:right-handed parallel beta-helix repeat-containing protein [Lachnospiraceae bacterium]